jgi:hypothetical protein
MRRWEVLVDLIRKEGITSVVEVGVLKAENASNILRAFPEIEFLGIDPYVGSLETYDHEKNKVLAEEVFSKYNNAELFIGISEEYPVSKKYDLVFIDGDHKYEGCLKDILFWKDKCKIIAGHDYSQHHPGVVQAVDEVFPKVQTFSDNVWMVVNESL